MFCEFLMMPYFVFRISYLFAKGYFYIRNHFVFYVWRAVLVRFADVAFRGIRERILHIVCRQAVLLCLLSNLLLLLV